MDPLAGRNVALGVSGSIACYKAVDLASKLTQAGARVDALLTADAARFVSALTFRSITHRPVVSDLFDLHSELSVNHVAVAERADAVIVAPATANAIAKIAHGLADDALTATILATRAPIIVAPAMDAHMHDNPATQQNIATLRARGCVIAGPGKGRLASGLVGKGRLLETPDLLGCLRQTLGRGGDCAGRKVVVSAGGTQEPIDAVRVIANRSSGKMGYAVAEAARDRGAQSVIVSGPTALAAPYGVRVVRVETALRMRDALRRECADADALIMAAAVADWRPESASDRKVKKGDADHWRIDLVKNPDIVAGIGGKRLVKVGFAAESDDLIANAQAKLVSKGLRLIAANDITASDSGFGADTNRVILLDCEGGREELPLMGKYDVAHRILDAAARFLAPVDASNSGTD